MGQNKEHRPYNSLIYTPICGERGKRPTYKTRYED